MRATAFSRALPLPLWGAGRTANRPAAVAVPAADPRGRGWLTLAVGSLVVAGLLSLAVVVGRLPLLSRIIDDPLFFKRCLVVHVDLALVVWFYAFVAGLLALESRGGALARGALALAAGGVGAMLAGGLVRGAEPILANYVPVIDHPLFGAGLAAFAVGVVLNFVHELGGAAPGARRILPPETRAGLKAAAVLVLLAAATWVAARAGLPEGVDAWTRAEFLAWGPGHVLQAANTAAMLAVWLWLARLVAGAPLLPPRAVGAILAGLVLPQAAMPLLTARGTLDTLYHSGATQLMRWAIFPAVLAVAVAAGVRLRRSRVRTAEARLAWAGLAGSAALALLGMALGACIRSSTTLVPAHYHASLGAVTLAFMTAAYLVCAALRPAAAPVGAAFLRAGRRQLALFGVGQTVFALGFALGGIYGLGRKTYAGEQHVRGAGEIAGLIVMGTGGLVAVAGGLWFLFLVLREVRHWWTRGPAAAASDFR